MAEIRVEEVGKEFGYFVAVRESSFTVRDGEFFVMHAWPLGLRQDHDAADDRGTRDAERGAHPARRRRSDLEAGV